MASDLSSLARSKRARDIEVKFGVGRGEIGQVLETLYYKGGPGQRGLTIAGVALELSRGIGAPIPWQTVARWMHKLGINPKSRARKAALRSRARTP